MTKTIDQSDPEQDFISDVEEADDEIESDEVGEMEYEDEGELEGEPEGEEEELEDKVDELESELEDLRAEFEKLLSGDEAGDEEIEGAEEVEPMGDMGMEPEMEEESVEYDLDEEVEEDDDEVVEEATKLSRRM